MNNFGAHHMMNSIETVDLGSYADLFAKLGLEIPETISKVATYDPTGPKLVIHQIENENFKSYFGKQILGPFHKNFTSIIGPNGSGKSNVIDSMLFVFGFRASKIRSKKISVLIHNSSKHQNISSCTVKVYFKKIFTATQEILHSHSEEVVGVSNSEFVISRTAFKDNSSYYCINGKKATFKEISDVLKSHGIDLDHNRFLILQGEVEQISLMKPKANNENEEGMLEFLEDIIGSNRFKPALAKLSVTLEEENERRADKLLHFKTVEKDLKSLEEPRNKALSFLYQENMVNRQRNLLYQVNQYISRQDLSVKEQKFEVINATLTQINEALSQSETLKKGIDLNYKRANKEYEGAYKMLEQNKKALTDLEVLDAKIREDYKHLNLKNKNLTKSIESDRQKLEECKSKVERNDELLSLQANQLTHSAKEKEGVERELTQAMESLKTQSKGVCAKKETLEMKLMKQLEDVEYKNAWAQLEKAKAELKLYNESFENRQLKINQTKEKLQEVAQNEVQTKGKLEELLLNILPNLEKQASEYKTKIDESKEAERKIESTLKELRFKMNELSDNLSLIREGGNMNPHASHKDCNKNYSLVLRTLMERQSIGEIDGVYGRLGDLGVIDGMYDVALSSSCGSTLDNILVRNEDTAQACVSLLKSLKLPPTTFICANQISSPANPSTAGPYVKYRLFDKITPIAPKFKSAFYFAVRETLVANDIDQATTLAYPRNSSGQSATYLRRNRVVTLTGEVIEISGTLSGGGSRLISGKMSSKFGNIKYDASNDKIIYPFLDPNLLGQTNKKESLAAQGKAERERETKISEMECQIRQIEKDCENLINKAKDIASVRLEIETKLRHLNSESLTQAKYNKEKWSMDLQDMEGKCDTLRSLLEELIAQTASSTTPSSPNKRQVNAMNKKIEEYQNIYDKLKSSRDELSQQIQLCNDQIKSMTDRTLQGPRNKLNDLNKEIDKYTKDTNKLNIEIDNLKKNIKKIENKLVSDEKEIEKNESTRSEYKIKMQEMEGEAKNLFADADKFKASTKALKVELGQLKKELDDMEASETENKSRLITIQNEHKTQTDAINHLKQEIERIERERMKLKLNYLPAGFIKDFINDNDVSDSSDMFEDEVEQHQHNQNQDMEIQLNQGDGEGIEELDNTVTPKVTPKRKLVVKLKVFTEEALKFVDPDKVKRDLRDLQSNFGKLKQPDLAIIEAYEDKEQLFLRHAKQLDELTAYKKSLQDLFNKLRCERLNQFLNGFTFITVKLKEIYRMITLGGDADLELVDSLDPFTEGVSFKVRPLNKSWKNVNNLSGGEKTLSSIALIFALHHYKPTPFYVMDEIDAALDFKNVSIVANYIKQRTQSAQFIIISLRHNMFELSDRLIGIYKTYDCTKNVVIETKKVVQNIVAAA